jgi:hypothetical protein
MIWMLANPFLGHWNGGALKYQLFRAQTALASLVGWHFRAQKVSISGPTPSNGPCNGYFPHQNHDVPHYINNRYINIYYVPEAYLHYLYIFIEI